ncbi:MAG: hypothetical protein LGR52_00445 [Candidatus Thiosymbion ectosymbiont of Robbea hypermnestra]|nr:hypothetical protein [Candidatus Thiosymbion ectosymbiont of Robbea hypermnestra]
MSQFWSFSVPAEVISGIWFGLSAIFLMLGRYLWTYRLASSFRRSGIRFWKPILGSSLLVGLGGLTLILFLHSVGLLVASNPGNQKTAPAAEQQITDASNQKTTPAAEQQITNASNQETPDKKQQNTGTSSQGTASNKGQKTTDPNLFIGIIAVVITLFTGTAMSMVFDLRREWQGEGKRHEEARAELRRDTLRLRQQLDVVAKTNELAAQRGPDGAIRYPQEFIFYRYLIRLFTDPRKVSGPDDLSLDLLHDLPGLRDRLTAENWGYIRWLATEFESDLPSIQEQIRSSAEKLYVSCHRQTNTRPA